MSAAPHAEPKSVGLAYVLLNFLGGLGIHRFYLGRTGSAVGLLILTLAMLFFVFILPFIGWIVGLPLLVAVLVWLVVDLFLIPGIAHGHCTVPAATASAGGSSSGPLARSGRFVARSALAILGCVAAPTWAQDDDHGDTPETATQINPNSETAGELENEDDVDYFRLDLEPFRDGADEAGGLVVRTVGDTDTYGRLRRPNGENVDVNDDSGQGDNFWMDLHLDAGTYYVRVSGRGTGEYTLLASFAADDHANDPDEGVVVTESAEFDAGLQTKHDWDYYLIELAEPHGMVVQTAGDTDTFGRLIRPNGEFVEEDYQNGQGRNFWMDLHLRAGTYYLAVTQTSRLGESSTYVNSPYTLIVDLEPDDHGGTRETATVMSSPSIVAGLQTRHDWDTFRFDLRRAGELTVQTYGSTDTWGELTRRNRLVVGRDYEDGQGRNLLIRANLDAGTYFLDVTQTSRLGESSRYVNSPYTLGVTFDGDEDIPYGGAEHSVPLFVRASNDAQQGFARIINRTDMAGTVEIEAIDDTGRRFGPVTLSLDADQTAHFNADDLEMGNDSKGLSGGVGTGTGDWRLEMETSLDIDVLAYTRTPDLLVRGMHDLVPATPTGWTVPFFNPGSNVERLSVVRLINVTDEEVTATIQGVDDDGARSASVQVEIDAGASVWIESDELESGECCGGAGIGDGRGKWQLAISATGTLQVMSLLRSLEGQLTNLSTYSPTAAADATTEEQ